MALLAEFKEFAMRGNVVDLAVGVVIGAAFGKIVTSLVNDIVMPLVGRLLGGVDFSHAAFQLAPAVIGADGKESAPAVLLRYGAFAQSVVDFLLVALAIFLVVKLINRLRRSPQVPEVPPAPAEEIALLTEIRDALRTR